MEKGSVQVPPRLKAGHLYMWTWTEMLGLSSAKNSPSRSLPDSLNQSLAPLLVIHRGYGAKSLPRQSNLPPCNSFHGDQEPWVVGPKSREGKNEDHNRMSRYDSDGERDSTGRQSSRPPYGIPRCTSCISRCRFARPNGDDLARDSWQEAAEHLAREAIETHPVVPREGIPSG